HTRSKRDWSSDVCSSDLQQEVQRGAQRALVQQLEEGVLAIVAGLTPDDRRGLPLDRLAIERHGLAVALHLELLQVGREAAQRVKIGRASCRGRVWERGGA